MKHTHQYVVNGSQVMSDLDLAFAAQSRQIGVHLGHSPWILIDQARIEGTVAHGFLTLAMASRMAQDTLPQLPGQVMNLNAGFDRLRFIAPLPSGHRIRGAFMLKNVTKTQANHLRMVTELTVEIEHSDTPALVADWINVAVFSQPQSQPQPSSEARRR
jgi:acyl dehydratase